MLKFLIKYIQGPNMKSAFIHDWLVDMGGAEKCVTSMLQAFPSDVYTLLYQEDTLKKMHIDPARTTPSFIHKIPLARRIYRNLLAWFPKAVESFDLSQYDLILSSSHAVARGVLKNADQLHISYCYTPIRYAWDLYQQYIQHSGLTRGLKGLYARDVLHKIRIWDQSTINRVDHFIAISKYIARRIKSVYNRDSVVIYPPVDVDDFPLTKEKQDYYLCASRMVPYKKMDLIVKSFAGMPDKKLIVIGTGPEWKKVKKAALNAPNIELMGYQAFPVLKEKMAHAKAFIFAAEEDFGIVPVEAQACGTPVIAYSKGGSLETVINGKTGVFFDEQTEESIQNAVRVFEKTASDFDPAVISKHAQKFSRSRFEKEYQDFIRTKWAEFEKERKKL